MFGWILGGVLGLGLMIAILAVVICFYRIFYTNRKEKIEEYPALAMEEYQPYREQTLLWMEENRTVRYTEVSIRSFDGLLLYGKYYEYEKGAPIELMIHGYRGSAECDLACGRERCFTLGHSALIIDHRACGKSEGNVITFGVLESRDILMWIDYIIEKIDKDAKIILTGISMGASTAMICAGETLPKNVVGVLADCGYSSAKEIIQKVMAEMKLPPKLLYPFAKLAAKLLGHFDLEEKSPIEAMKRCRLPIIFFHGESDNMVPCDMSLKNYEACASKNKKLVTVKGAGHVLSFMVDQENYYKELREFFDPLLKEAMTV